MVTPLMLHHFDASPFAEKIRVALGVKGLAWQSVEIPMVMPKPDLTLLTGGYRKTPVLQIGADIYCDTQRIATELDRRFPGQPSLFNASTRALSEVVATWSDISLFQAGAGLSMGTNLDLPEAVLADRFAFFDFLDREQLPAQLPDLFASLRAGLQRIEDMLAQSGQPFLLGPQPGWADIACYAPVWMCRGNVVGADALFERLPALVAWESRMRQIGEGKRTEISANTAHQAALGAAPIAIPELAPDRLPRCDAGDTVEVMPEDYGAVPVTGQLVRLTQHDIAVSRSAPKVGEVVVHFPRAGYKVKKI